MDKGRMFVNTGSSDGAFERFLTSAIATILTIIFSWRLLIETENGQQLCIEDAAGGDKESGATKPGDPDHTDKKDRDYVDGTADDISGCEEGVGRNDAYSSGSMVVNASQYVISSASGEPLVAHRSITPQELQANLLKTEGISRAIAAQRADLQQAPHVHTFDIATGKEL